MSKFSSWVLLALACTSLPLRAEPGLVISLNNVADRIRSQNPDLAAARVRIQEAVGRMNQAGRLANPELETSIEQNSEFREGRLQFELSQRFPITDRLRLEKEISLTELKMSEAEVREVERLLVGQARTAIVHWLANRAHLDLLAEQTANAQQLADALTRSQAQGEASALDVSQAKLATASLAIESRSLNAKRAELAGALKLLLGIRATEPLNISGKLPEPTPPKTLNPISQRPDLQAAKLAFNAATKELSLEYARRYDDVEGGIFAAAERSEDVPEGLTHEAMLGIRFKLALPFWNKNEGAIKAAEAKQQRRRMETAALTRNIHLEAQTAHAEMLEWATLVDEITGNLLPLANEQSKLTEAAYQNAEETIQGLLSSREKCLELASARLNALREFHLARIRHESALAQP
jgi:cobalt-zinc-cadmium efflux system outer membrane protein